MELASERGHAKAIRVPGLTNRLESVVKSVMKQNRNVSGCVATRALHTGSISGLTHIRCEKDKYTCDGYQTTELQLLSDCQTTTSPFVSPDVVSLPCYSPATPQVQELLSNLNYYSDSHYHSPGRAFDTTNPLMEPSSLWGQGMDQLYSRYFFQKVVPLFSTTRSWRFFWQYTVPQVAWQYPSIQHAMIALAAACNSLVPVSDRMKLVMLKSNLSIREFSTEPATSDIALILCRLLTCVSQCTGQWSTSAMHMRNGRKILKEACRDRPRQTDLVRLMAPTLLGISSSVGEDSEIVEKMPYDTRQSFTSLEFIRKQYGSLLTAVHKADWPSIDSETNALLLLGWSTVTRAINSVAFPDVFNLATDEPIVPAAQVWADLLSEGKFISLDELVALSLSLFRHIHELFLGPTLKNCRKSHRDWKSELRLLVENYVAHVARVEPRTTAGTFWHAEIYGHCSVRRHFTQMEDGGGDEIDNETQISNSGSSRTSVDDSADDRRGYYLENVCPYRSGFTPAWYS